MILELDVPDPVYIVFDLEDKRGVIDALKAMRERWDQ